MACSSSHLTSPDDSEKKQSRRIKSIPLYTGIVKSSLSKIAPAVTSLTDLWKDDRPRISSDGRCLDQTKQVAGGNARPYLGDAAVLVSAFGEHLEFDSGHALKYCARTVWIDARTHEVV